MTILAHRANLLGPNPATENSLPAVLEALNAGFGLETDLRRDGAGQFYIAHDAEARTDANDFRQYAALFRRFPGSAIAMNVKELGYEPSLVELWVSGHLGESGFYFDFELLEPQYPGRAQRLIHASPGGAAVPMAARLSDRNETLAQCLSIPATVVWADEFDSLWLTGEIVEAVHAAGRKFYVISPELHHFTDADRLARWRDFKRWKVDGICTDFSFAAREFFSK